MKKFTLVLLQLTLLLGALPIRAADSAVSMILSDQELTSADVPDGFSQAFLEARGGAISKMTFTDLDGSLKKPGDLIDYYGKIFGVNPRYLLALIQKEQSLVSDKNPSVCQIDWAAGYGRPDGSTCDDPAWQRYRGFTMQIISAAAFVECFYHDSNDRCGNRRNFGLFPGQATNIDGQTVIPGNLATALLYTYTPHVHGNQNLLKIWKTWFSTGYPDGTALKSPSGEVFLIQAGLKRRFANKGAIRTRVDASRIIRVTDDILKSFEDGADIKFSDYTIARVPTGTVYLLTGDRKRHIESMEVFRAIGFNPEEIDDVTDEDLEPYADGDTISIRSAYPTGTLLQDKITGGVYFVENGIKRPIISAQIMKLNFPNKKISSVSASTLNKYEEAEPVKFRDGELITSPGSNKAVFVVSNGLRRPIVSGQVFEQLGYSWKRVIYTSDEAVGLHPIGEPVIGLTTGVETRTAMAN